MYSQKFTKKSCMDNYITILNEMKYLPVVNLDFDMDEVQVSLFIPRHTSDIYCALDDGNLVVSM